MAISITNPTLQVVGGCLGEVLVPPGCECGDACTASASNITVACRTAIINTYCENAVWIEADLQVNLRAIFLHLLNDCTDGESIDCPASVSPSPACPSLSKLAQRSLHRTTSFESLSPIQGHSRGFLLCFVLLDGVIMPTIAQSTEPGSCHARSLLVSLSEMLCQLLGKQTVYFVLLTPVIAW